MITLSQLIILLRILNISSGGNQGVVLPSAAAGTTENLVATYNNGASGIGATLTMDADGVFTTDGETPAADALIFVWMQDNPAFNGLYNLTDTGSVSSQAVLTRSTDFDGSVDGPIIQGSLVTVTNGDTLSGKTFTETSNGPFIVGVSPITFAVFSGLSATSPLNITDNTISILPSGVSAGSVGDAGKTLQATVNALGLLSSLTETDINILAAQVSDFDTAAAAAAPVQLVAGKTGDVVLDAADITDFNAAASAAAPVQLVAGKTGAVTLVIADISGLVAALAAKQDADALLASLAGLGSTLGVLLQTAAGVAGIFAPTNHAVIVGGASGALNSLAVGTNGQVILGATGADPAFATLTSADSTIGFTLGANTLALSAVQATTSQRGTATIATNAEAIAGTVTDKIIVPSSLLAKLGALTLDRVLLGAGNTAAIAVSNAATDGQTLAGVSGGTPAFGAIGIRSGLTANGFIFGGGAAAFSASAAPTNGQIPIGKTGDKPTLGLPTDSNNIVWTAGAGTLTASFQPAYGTTITGNKTFAAADNGKIFLVNISNSALNILTFPNVGGGSGTAGWCVYLVNIGTIDAILNHQSGDVLDGPSYVLGPDTTMTVTLNQVSGGINYYEQVGGTQFKAYTLSQTFYGTMSNNAVDLSLCVPADVELLGGFARAASGSGTLTTATGGISITGGAFTYSGTAYLYQAFTNLAVTPNVPQGRTITGTFSGVSSLVNPSITLQGFTRSFV